MAFSAWLIAILVLILLVLIAVAFLLWWRNREFQTVIPPSQLPPATSYWSKASPGPDPERNVCELYQFPSKTITIGSETFFVPATPTFSNEIIEQLQGTTGIPVCIDPDQLIAQQVEHTCNNPTGMTQNNPSVVCRNQDGGFTGLGEKEIYYSNVLCRDIPACAGQLSILSLQYLGPKPNITPRCVTAIEDPPEPVPTVDMSLDCDFGDQNQIFRVTRVNPGQNPNDKKASNSQNGFLAKMEHRESGMCLGLSAVTGTINPNSLATVPCNGDFPTLNSGRMLDLVPCGTGPTGYPGYNWAFLPTLDWQVASTEAKNAQQILYIGNQVIDEIPFFNGSGYYLDIEEATYTGTNALVAWKLGEDIPTMYWGNDPNDQIVALAYGYPDNVLSTLQLLDSTSCLGKGALTQYINYNLYNQMLEKEACDGNNELVCWPF